MPVLEGVRSVIAEVLGVKEDKIGATTDLVAELDADSLDIVEIDGILEEKYGIEITDDDLEEMKCLRDIVDYVEGRIKVK
ncbi:MAG: acyl carrier protein [Actinobacteria bacterium]|nr:acyl carrier protein [Actinomycetota bacterium]MCG2817782.1 acyl carrier protein [Actinomycetes bacterium]MBU4359649.1 acyl carrier protein [Actinomycetota bacterium]MBU4391906.1 acyl carrier protein [Actinomycetota bacterium]MBU4403467.1 acyl carrier protein [Actinomycetota bacterium]